MAIIKLLHDTYPSINSPTFVVGDNNFDVTKGKSKDYYNLLIREKAKPPNIIKKLQSNFHFNSDNLKQIFKLPHSIVVESYVKAFQYKVINSILYTNTKLYKIGFRTNDLRTFCDNQPESNLWDCRSKQILPNIYGFMAKIVAKYETEEKISIK